MNDDKAKTILDLAASGKHSEALVMALGPNMYKMFEETIEHQESIGVPTDETEYSDGQADAMSDVMEHMVDDTNVEKVLADLAEDNVSDAYKAGYRDTIRDYM